ncbi:contractile injection system protein, VgrG/Pvc8 family [Paraburkholderia solisilvae]|uniref:Type VI secretion system secreted protein VgrG n=1 Tax=Paraburkholderia solisilvae TaxID=624376 RepID=A0A6J5F4U2_9BURK|nr:contractile injection system protein, VgrG/Pvc8 family [Paraburkholderia solisilvae]CAB3772771.1 hypothetical protein LMG29739_06326 [Paraburkholderia solisilvae]
MSARDDIGTTRIERIESPDPAVFLHVGIFLPGGRILGAQTLRAERLTGEERVSQPFSFELELRANETPSARVPALRFDHLIGRPVTIGIDRPDPHASAQGRAPDAAGASNLRFAALLAGGAPDPTLTVFNGIVTAFSMSQPGVYRASIKPALWKLTLTNRYRVLAQMSVADAIGALLREHGIACSLDGIAGSHNLARTRVQDWLQAGESDFALLQRLMGKAHIHYYFEHTGTGHTVMFSNRAQYPQISNGGRPLRYTFTDQSENGLIQDDVVSEYTFEQSLVTSGVDCVLALQQEVWEMDTIPVFQTYFAERSHSGELPFTQYKQYQYGVSARQADEIANASDATRRASAANLSGSSTCAQMRVGYRFELVAPADQSAAAPVQPSLEHQWFVLTQVTHEADQQSYHNRFTATESSGLITPFSLDETQQGSLFATVVNADGSTAPTNWRYYSKENFEMVTNDLIDRDASPQTLHAKGVYVRFATERDGATTAPVWVKLAAHMQTVPEVGVTVVVTRAQDESELPEIQSIVHANGSRVITPSGWTANTSVGSSHSTSYGDNLSIRFGAASDVSSQRTLDHAIDLVSEAYASGQYRDASYSQGASYSYATSESGAQGWLSRSYSYGSSFSANWAAQQQSFSAVGRVYSESVHGRSDPAGNAPSPSPAPDAVIASVTTVHGDTYNQSANHGNTTSLNTVTGNSTSTNVVSGTSASDTKIGSNESVSTIGSSSNRSTTLVTENVNMVGMSTDTSMMGITRSMSLIGSTSTTGVIGSSSSTNVTAESSSTSMTGTHDSLNLVGVSSSVDIQGSTTSMSLVGSSTRMSLADETFDMSLTATETRISMVAEQNTIQITGPGIHFSSQPEQPDIKVGNASITLVGVIQIYL